MVIYLCGALNGSNFPAVMALKWLFTPSRTVQFIHLLCVILFNSLAPFVEDLH